MVVHIPCTVDTLSPTFMILGEAATTMLQSYDVLPYGEINIIVKGIMEKNGYQLTYPVVSQLPNHLYSTPAARDLMY